MDGLRAISALCIVAMHLYANFGMKFENFVFSKLISSFGQLTLLFMMLSGFAMCCGYYERIMSQTISITEFYERRYTKILPFFALITFVDVLTTPLISSVYEGFANLTLAFGLLPNPNIQVIGMGWTLGTIFVFYMLFPFFCFLIKTKKSAWISLLITIVYHYFCSVYFFDEAHVLNGYWSASNIIYCSMFFIAGGIIFLYRKELIDILSKFHWVVLLICIVLTVIYYAIPALRSDYYLLWVFSAWLIYGLHNENIVLNNPVAKFLSGISMEIYLSHMFIFRIIEKLNLKYLFGKNIPSYIVTVCLTIGFTIIFATVVNFVIRKVSEFVNCKRNALKR